MESNVPEYFLAGHFAFARKLAESSENYFSQPGNSLTPVKPKIGYYMLFFH